MKHCTLGASSSAMRVPWALAVALDPFRLARWNRPESAAARSWDGVLDLRRCREWGAGSASAVLLCPLQPCAGPQSGAEELALKLQLRPARETRWQAQVTTAQRDSRGKITLRRASGNTEATTERPQNSDLSAVLRVCRAF